MIEFENLNAKVICFLRFHRSRSCKYRAKRFFCKVYTTLYRFFTKKIVPLTSSKILTFEKTQIKFGFLLT